MMNSEPNEAAKFWREFESEARHQAGRAAASLTPDPPKDSRAGARHLAPVLQVPLANCYPPERFAPVAINWHVPGGEVLAFYRQDVVADAGQRMFEAGKRFGDAQAVEREREWRLLNSAAIAIVGLIAGSAFTLLVFEFATR